MELGLKDKRVLITASSAGIGRAAAESFLREGAVVIINGRNADKLEHVRKDMADRYGDNRVFAVDGDASDSETMQRLVKAAEDKLKGLDILVPCVGTGKAVSAERLDIEEWQHMMDKNTYSAVALVRECMPLLMKGTDPSVVLISSVVAMSRASAPYAYAAAKNAILTLNGYMAGDYKKTGIRVNCVVPGNVFFEGGRWEELKAADPKGVETYISDNVPMGRFGKPEEIADAIVFLSSGRSAFTNGAVLTIDGGQDRSI